MAASPDQQPWSFDVASLMVLVNESEEEKYRLSQRSFLECVAMAPVVGLQNYLRSYDFLLDAAKTNYFSPYGVKAAPLRYMRLSNAINQVRKLEDSRYSVYRIPDSQFRRTAGVGPGTRRYHALVTIWVALTWIVFGGLVIFTIMVPETTWIGISNCVAFTGWSIVLRLIEAFNIQPAKINDSKITLPDHPDAVYIMGRNNSAFVLEGTRRHIKYWTVRGLVYRKSTLGIPAVMWQTFTRAGSLLMLLFVFSSIPNGSTMDQVAFIAVNLLAQVNALVGQHLNGLRCLSELELAATETPTTRTEVYGLLVRRFKALDLKNEWVEASGLLPQTKAWKEWKTEVLKDDGRDSNEIYRQIAERERKENPFIDTPSTTASV